MAMKRKVAADLSLGTNRRRIPSLTKGVFQDKSESAPDCDNIKKLLHRS